MCWIMADFPDPECPVTITESLLFVIIFSISLAAFVEIKKASSSFHWQNIEFSNSVSEIKCYAIRICILVIFGANYINT